MAKKTEKEIDAAEHLAQIEEEEQRLVRTLDNLRHAKERLRPHGMFKSEQSADRVVLAERVTRRHGEIFAKTFLAMSSRTEAPGEAFELSGVMEWPDDLEDESPAKLRHERLEDEILRRVFDEIETPLREAFISIADDVISRERRRL